MRTGSTPFGGMPLFAVASAAIHAAIALAVVRTPRQVEGPPPNADPRPALTGDTFDLSDPGDDGLDVEEELTAPSPIPAPAPVQAPGRSAKASRRTHPIAAKGAPGDPGTAAAPAPYGAVGERGVADLTTAFTRAFPQAASADPAWTAVPFGDAGNAEVTLVIDVSGALVSTSIAPSAPPALRAGIARTLALIRGRAFTARGATTRLQLRARVSPDQIHDGLHGDVFALGGSFSGSDGSAFFALAIGRRIDVSVHAK